MKHKEKEPKEKPEKKSKPQKEKKPRKEREYTLRKNTLARVMRVIMWGILFFIFFKGIMASVRPDRTNEVDSMINDFRQEFYNQKDNTEEVFGFAQNFIKEYLTYTVDGQEDYLNRIKPYVSEQLLSVELCSFKGDAKATYVKAYRKEDYSENQMDVYVLAEVTYTVPELQEDNTYQDQIIIEQTTLKVPVYIGDKGYCIEDIPLVVADDITQRPVIQEFVENEINNPLIEEALTNFLEAYYSQDQSVIDYYLLQSADKLKFIGLRGRYAFEKIIDLKTYQVEGQQDIICPITIQIVDTINSVTLMQNFNITVAQEGERIYVKDLNTKRVNLYISN